jgi:hypothetical protein
VSRKRRCTQMFCLVCKDIGANGDEAVCIYWIEPVGLVPDAAAAVSARLPVRDVVLDGVFVPA